MTGAGPQGARCAKEFFRPRCGYHAGNTHRTPPLCVLERTAYDIELSGLAAAPGTIDVVTLRDVLDTLIDVAGRTLRLSVEGTSTRQGRRPEWMSQSVRFLVKGMHKGSTVLPIDAPRLGESAEAVIHQQDLWLPRPDATALTVLAHTVRDVEAERRESERYDRGILAAITRFGRVVQNGERITVRDVASGEPVFAITREHVEHADRLQQALPEPRAVVLAGHLSMIKDEPKHGEPRTFELRTEDGRGVRGRASGEAVETERLRALWKRKVTIQGRVHFTPAGTARFVEARVVRPFSERDVLFEKTASQIEREAARQRPLSGRALRNIDAGAGIAAIRGTWPGDETIGEILDALRG